MIEREKPVPTNLLIFDIYGCSGHFRKFYTNSSSLSYDFPPRTTIVGLIAGIVGLPSERFDTRNPYYEKFSTNKCRVAISVRKSIRKIMQTVNYVRTKNLGELNLSAGHTQIPLEIILPERNSDEIRYRIYFYHMESKINEIMEELKERLKTNKFAYLPYLGLSEFIAGIQFVDAIESDKIIRNCASERSVDIATVINVNCLHENSLTFKSDATTFLQYIKDRMPLDFTSERKLKNVQDFIYEKNINKIKARVDEYYEITYREPQNGTILTENIVFMEA
jgi:CRISPR-associated protein Cas5h